MFLVSYNWEVKGSIFILLEHALEISWVLFDFHINLDVKDNEAQCGTSRPLQPIGRGFESFILSV